LIKWGLIDLMRPIDLNEASLIYSYGYSYFQKLYKSNKQ